MTTLLSAKDDEIPLLKAKLVVAKTERLGSDEVLELKAKILICLLKWPISRTSHLSITWSQMLDSPCCPVLNPKIPFLLLGS